METKFVSAYTGDHGATHLVSALMEGHTPGAVVEPYMKEMGGLEQVLRRNFEQRYLTGLPPEELETTRQKFEIALAKIPTSIPIYGSVDELIANEQGNLAIIHAGPDKTHAPDGAKILEAGHHLFLEKPIAQTREELSRILSISRHPDHQKQAFRTCYIREFDDPFMWLNKNFRVVESIIGSVQRFDFHIAYPEPSKGGLHTSFLSDHLPHELHLLCWLLAPRLKGKTKHTIMLHDKNATHYHVSGFIEGSEDSRKINFHLGGGRGLKKGDEQKFEERITLTGDEGSLVIDLNSGKGSYDMFNYREKRTKTVGDIGAMNYRGRTARINEEFFTSIESYSERGFVFTDRDAILDTIEMTTGSTIDLDNSQPGDIVKI